MDAGDPPRELVEHLARSTRLAPAEARRLVLEVLAYYRETPQQYVARRHAELRAEGHANAVIYGRLAEELCARRFAAAPLSERQIRRLIYG